MLRKTGFRAMNQQAFTMVEVVIAGVIFTIMAVGSYSTISAFKKPASATKEEVTAAYLGQQILDELRTKVDGSTWTTGSGGDLDPNGGSGSNGIYSLADMDVDGTTYSTVYQVENDTSTMARKVTITVSW